MATLSKQLKDLDKELGVTKIHDRDKAGKIEYVETQIHEMRAIMWRLRTDTLLSMVIPTADDKAKVEREEQRNRLKGDIREMAKAINVLVQLRDELKD